MYICVLSHLSRVWLFAMLWTIACQAPQSMGFSRQEYWSRLPCPPPRDLPDPGIELMSLTSYALASEFFSTSTAWKVSVYFRHIVVSNSLWPHRLQHVRLPCPSPNPGVYSNSCPSSWWCHPTISSSVVPFCPPTFNLSQHQGIFQWVRSLHQVAKVLELHLQRQSFQWIFRTDFL